MSINTKRLEILAKEKGMTLNELLDEIDKEKNPDKYRDGFPEEFPFKVCNWA